MKKQNSCYNAKVCNLAIETLSKLYKMQACYEVIDNECLASLHNAIVEIELIQSKVCQLDGMNTLNNKE